MGADTARIPPISVPMLPGWESGEGGFAYGPEFAKPHTFIVDGAGRRFCNDSYWVDLVAKALDPQDRHLPFYLVWDEQHRRKYGLGTVPPGGDYPSGVVTSSPTLRELGAALESVTELPFHGIRLRFLGTGIGSSGVRTDADGRVLGGAGVPIPGLYAAGSVAALTSSGSGYNSGFALGRGLTAAYLISQELGAERAG